MSYRVRVEDSGHEFVCEEGEDVLNAVLRAGYAFPYSCKTGTCASCRGRVVEGRVHY
ncbi:MAG TPA: 2Fe-2S iron-sulfur cluster binding domain-containing protein, partial [Halothiobacillaceae bacterium]|nr:2Fe-2S iron-sulfur cluster binding domain-containing protein [Halothiobacillaceae bacterium]